MPALGLIAGVALAACAPTTEEAENPEPAAVTQLEEPVEEEPAAAEPTDAGETAAPDDDAVAADDPACLVGDWLITEDSMQAFYDSMDAPATFTVNGDTGLAFRADDTYEYTPGFTLEIDMGGMIASGTLTGSIAGSYETADGVITTSNEDNDIDLTVSAGGTTMDGSDLGEGFLSSSPVNSADFECTPEGPVLTWQGGSGGLDITLIPAR